MFLDLLSTRGAGLAAVHIIEPTSAHKLLLQCLGAAQGYYFSGDGCRRDEDGYYWITGRVDDVINVSGCATLYFAEVLERCLL